MNYSQEEKNKAKQTTPPCYSNIVWVIMSRWQNNNKLAPLYMGSHTKFWWPTLKRNESAAEAEKGY